MNFERLPASKLVALTLLSASAIAQSPTGYIADWKNDASGAYTIIHDDYGDTGVDGIWQYADTICSNRGVKFTFGAIADRCEQTRNVNGYSNPYQYAKNVMMAQHGHEIMSHSHTHDCAVGNAGWSPCDAPVGDAWGEDVGGFNFNQQLVTAHNSIVTGTGFTPKYYIYPYDRFTDATNDKLKDMEYLGSRTGWTSPRAGDASYHRNGYENSDLASFFPDADGFFRTAVQVFDANDQALNDAGQTSVLNDEVDAAIANNMWANRELHNVGNTGWGSVTVNAYRDHIDYVKSKMESGELWVGTVSEFLTYQMQKLKFSPNVTYDSQSDKVFVTWNSIGAQYNVNISNYLSGLEIKSPITLVVDLNMSGTWSVLQNSQPVSDVNQVGDKLYINVYPHEGDLEIYKDNGNVNLAPFVDNAIQDYNMVMNFTSFQIDLKNVFGDQETSDNDLIYTYSGNSNIQISITNGVATISTTNNWEGAETITFTAEDEGGLTVSDVFSIVVSDLFGGQLPYSGTPISIPGRVEAEDYDTGGEGIAFHEVATSWEPDPVDNPYRANEDPDVAEYTTGNFGLGYTETGEWLEYTVDVVASGWYRVIYRISQLDDVWNTPIGRLKLYVDNIEVAPAMLMKYTASWEDYEDVEYPDAFHLTQGKHLVRLEFDRGSVNVDYFDILDSPVGTEDVKTAANFKVFPNPASDQINLEGDFNVAKIYNQTGELVLTTTEANVFIDELAEGVYYVKFDNVPSMTKFIKTK